MRNAASQGESQKVTGKNSRPVLNETETPEIQVNPLVKTQEQIRKTYHECTEAQKDFKNAFKSQEKETQEAFKDSEKRYKAYEEALEIAFKNREAAEQKANESYQKTIENAREIYLKDMKRALKDCKKSTEQAGELLAGIFVKEKKSVSQNPGLLNIHSYKLNLGAAKSGFFKFGKWFEDKKTVLVQKLNGHSKTSKVESLAE